MAVEVEHVAGDEGDDFAEEWSRVTDNDDVLGVSAVRFDDGSWQVWVAVQEYVREVPVDSELRAAMVPALRVLPGVTFADEEDRETYLIEGDVSGEALVRAAAAVIDTFEDRLQAAYDNPT